MEINYKKISEKIIKLAEADQKMRFDSQQGEGEWNENVDKVNSNVLEDIIDDIGWPTISKMGKEASYAAWLIAQHADQNPIFQAKCLRLMKECKKNDIDPTNVSYLEDRVLVNQGKKQIYGTQFYTNKTKEIVPRPIKDMKNIEILRKEVGLEPFEVYAKKIKGTYKATNESAKIGRFYKVT